MNRNVSEPHRRCEWASGSRAGDFRWWFSSHVGPSHKLWCGWAGLESENFANLTGPLGDTCALAAGAPKPVQRMSDLRLPRLVSCVPAWLPSDYISV